LLGVASLLAAVGLGIRWSGVFDLDGFGGGMSLGLIIVALITLIYTLSKRNAEVSQ
jgi:hypothetical protein